MIEIGKAVIFLDAWKTDQKTGMLIDYRRSVKNPWKVAVVRLDDGAEVEVHPDRLEMMETITDERLRNKHQMVGSGQKASCTCGLWECRTDEVVEADILKTLQKQYSLHLADRSDERP
jgi:hypothetical protein